MAILYTLELAQKYEYPIEQAVPSNSIPRIYDIYELYIGPRPTNTYWTGWGGAHDNIESATVILFFNQFLNIASDFTDLENTPYSYLIAGDLVYLNVPKHPWLYPDSQTQIRLRQGYLSGPPNPDNPSTINIDGEPFPVRFKVPSFSVKLSDVISGLVKYSTFSGTLWNNDGYFDNTETVNLFNSPVLIKRTWKDNPTQADFITIRSGFVENIESEFDEITIHCADKYRSLEEPVCKIVSEDDYTITETSSIGDEIPLVYGTVSIDLIKLTNTTFLACEGLTNVAAVYNSDGASLTFTVDYGTGIITQATGTADYATVTGITTKKIGEIITDLVTRKTDISYTSDNWDLTEVTEYTDASPDINITLEGGSVKEAIAEILKSDMAFLIQLNTGVFTLRKWGNVYNQHTIESWKITKKPSRTFEDAQENYFSSCIVRYGHNEKEDTYASKYLDDSNEARSLDLYSKSTRSTFDTRLIDEADAIDLAERLGRRFSTLKETITVSVGEDTAEYNLLDAVSLPVVINGRAFSNNTNWTIKEINPAQDTLVLEETTINDYTGETPIEVPYEYDLDGGEPDTTDYVWDLDGGTI